MADRSPAPAPDPTSVVAAITAWFAQARRPLPWRATSPWGVLVSEFMLQQTPVDRVLPVWQAWLDRWASPSELAAEPQSEVIRAWGRLGYPRRAQRLHQAAISIRDQHGGQVPQEEEDLRALPGVGEYTAAAIRAFAFGRRSLVLDTNVRRVLARVVDGSAMPTAHITRAERESADRLWPASDEASALWSAAVMEFGALVCTARAPACEACPIRHECAWQASGSPETVPAMRRQPRYEGSDRQARGALLAVLRDAPGSVTSASLAQAWPAAEQRARALAGLIEDGLVDELPRRRYALSR